MHPEVQEMNDIVYLAGDPDEFVAKLLLAAAEDSPERQGRRLLVAQQHSWESRVDDMMRVLQEPRAQTVQS